MSLQRIFSLFLVIFSLFGITEALKLNLFNANGYVAEGFFPLFFSLGLLFCAIPLFILDKSTKKFNFHESVLQGEQGKAFVFFLLQILLIILLLLFGPLIAMFVFTFLASLALKRLTFRMTIVFTVVYVLVIYFIFVVLVRLPFGDGIVFEMLGYY